ncbi:MAG: hypothetical protein KF810_13775 [Rhizobiaceae bacterium]|nr:hypothetical protein [Rhizobiaceae bacterium]
MTRHSLVMASAAGASPPAKDPRAPVATGAINRVATSLEQDRLDRAEAQRSGLVASIPALPSGGNTIADIGRSSKSP